MADTPYNIQRAARTLDERVANLESLVRLSVLSAGGSLPTTTVGTAFDGIIINTTDQYRELYRNRYTRLIALKVVAEFSAAGQALALSLTTDANNYGKVDELVQGGKTTSDTLWLRPDQTLYANTLNTAVSLTGATFRALLFDPLSFADFIGGGI